MESLASLPQQRQIPEPTPKKLVPKPVVPNQANGKVNYGGCSAKPDAASGAFETGKASFNTYFNVQAPRNKLPPNCTRDLTGQRFGKWAVQAFAGMRGRSRLWLCRCDCGVEKPVFEIALIGCHSTQCRSCSWISRSKRMRLIGKGDVKSYRAWNRLRQFGLLPREWHDYEAFVKAGGNPPATTARLARRDVTMPHAPGNTYWMIPQVRSHSRHTSKKYKAMDIAQDEVLVNMCSAKTRDERIRGIIIARNKGYSYETIGMAAGITRQAVHQIIRKHVRQQVCSLTEHGLDMASTISGVGAAAWGQAHFVIGQMPLMTKCGLDPKFPNGYIGTVSGSTGVVTVAGTGSTWTNSGDLYVGNSGNGTLNITGGGAVSNTQRLHRLQFRLDGHGDGGRNRLDVDQQR